MRTWLCVILLLAVAAWPSKAASRTENAAFSAAAKAFQDGLWERARRELEDFVRSFPQSERRAQAVLMQAQALCKLGDRVGAIQLLSANAPAAGALVDQYLFWIGEAEYQNTNYAAAAAAFRKVTQEFPASKLRLDASVNEAASWAGLQDWERVVALLSAPEGAFQQMAGAAPTRPTVARGLLLLAEAHMARQEFGLAEAVLRKCPAEGLEGELAWRRTWLLCRALLGNHQAEAALTITSNLLALAGTQPELLAETHAVEATALEELGRLEKAAAAYALNLTSNAPVTLQRQALLKLAELALGRGRLAEAVQALTEFLQRFPDSPACDMALLTLGELQLRQHLATGAGATTNASATNLLGQALASFDTLCARFPDSPLAAKAQLNRGWCLALGGQADEAIKAFDAAARTLPPSLDQAVARFKLADLLCQQGRFAAALTNYQAVVRSADSLPAVRTNLCEPALYQTVRAAVEAGDLGAASEAVDRILAWFPDSHVTESSLLLAGQGLARHSDPVAARRVFEDLLRRFPNSPREAEVRLAVARTHELQNAWTNAVSLYQDWLARFPNHVARPRAEFDLAWAYYQAGDETNALAGFTNFVARYTTNELSPRAQWWVADHYFRRGGGGYAEAERNYQLLAQNWPTSALAYEARMMAGRAAMARQGWADAIGYFTNLTSDLQCPIPLKVQALFGYGDALRRLPASDTNNPLANFEEARRVFAKVLELNPTNAAAARAWGEIADCWLQLATRDAVHYAAASNAFQQVLDLPEADLAARSQALVGLGIVAERLADLQPVGQQNALLQRALDYYLDVLYERHLRPGERWDASGLFWLKRAGLDAARLAETLQAWPQAVRLYERLIHLLPPLRPSLEKRLEKARERAGP